VQQPETLILPRSAVAAGLRELDLVALAEDVLTRHALGETQQSPELTLGWENAGGAACRSLVKLGAVGRRDVGLKLINASAGNRAAGLERASGLCVLYDPETARPTVVAEAALLGGVRTAAVTAVALRHLGPPAVEAVSLLGAGTLAGHHLDVLAAAFPSLREAHVYDRHPERVKALAARGGRVRVVPCASARAAVAATDVLVTLTTSHEPYIGPDWFARPTFVAHVSLDDLDERVLLGAEGLYVDDEALAAHPRRILGRLLHDGRIAGSHADAPSTARRIDATLGDVLLGSRPAIRPSAGVVAFNPYGLAVLDVALLGALSGLERIRSRALPVDLLG
jgi:ornithine cyclodeaminase